MKTRIYLVMRDHGDGSAGVRPFLDKDAAEGFAETLDQRFCDDVTSINVAIEDGKVVLAD